MKRLIYAFLVTSIFFTVSVVSASSQQFCAGFERGFIAGYQKIKNTSVPPVAPVCPVQPIKMIGDPESDFEHGYQIGFVRGMNS